MDLPEIAAMHGLVLNPNRPPLPFSRDAGGHGIKVLKPYLWEIKPPT